MGLYEIKRFCTIKKWSLSEEATNRMGENLCQLYIREGTDNQNIQNHKKLNCQRINDPVKKWANELNRAPLLTNGLIK
jgi:hypothetical protein